MHETKALSIVPVAIFPWSDPLTGISENVPKVFSFSFSYSNSHVPKIKVRTI